jgi:hypothetical protein
VPTFSESDVAPPAGYTGFGSLIVPILNVAVLETLTKRILILTVTEAIRSVSPVPCAETLAESDTPASVIPNTRASTEAEKPAPKAYSVSPGKPGLGTSVR